MSVLVVALGCLSLLCVPGSQTLPLQPKSRESPDRALVDGNPWRGLMIHLFNNAWTDTETRMEKAAVHGPQPAWWHPRIQSHFRGKRQTHSRTHHHFHLMRVGCSLGTCQIQNLSHRLWQLMGQAGREDSSRINPNSPNSYG